MVSEETEGRVNITRFHADGIKDAVEEHGVVQWLLGIGLEIFYFAGVSCQVFFRIPNQRRRVVGLRRVGAVDEVAAFPEVFAVVRTIEQDGIPVAQRFYEFGKYAVVVDYGVIVCIDDFGGVASANRFLVVE